MLIESGGDNLTLTFSPALVDYFIYVIDVAAGDKIPRKNGPGITHSDILVINKTDLAPHVGASLDVMQQDSRLMRGSKPFLFTNCKTGAGHSGTGRADREGVSVRHHAAGAESSMMLGGLSSLGRRRSARRIGSGTGGVSGRAASDEERHGRQDRFPASWLRAPR